MSCSYYGKCAGCNLNLPYNDEISFKTDFLKSEFKEFYQGEIEIFKSDEWNFRNHAEFGIWHEKGDVFYTMRGNSNERVKIETCPKMDKKIVEMMPKLLQNLRENKNLKERLFGIEFIATKFDFMAILLYHKDIFNIKDDLAKLAEILDIKISARSRGKFLNFGGEILREKVQNFIYRFNADAFFQSNTKVNEKMILFVLNAVKNGKDLLEMYCGHGNFTLPLASEFGKILANEISKNSIKNARENSKNKDNIKFVRMSAKELIDAFNGVREFNRLKDIDITDFDFSHVLVDPPRAGIEPEVLDFIQNFKNIIYISCNPASLKQNLQILCETYKITKFALFDQFVHTEHIECGVVLQK